MTRAARGGAAWLVACSLAAGCVNAPDYQSSVGLAAASAADVWSQAAVAGAHGCGTDAERLVRPLVTESGLPDASASLSADELALVAGDPASLGAAVDARAGLRVRIGRAHLLVLECARPKVLEYGRWDVLVVTPVPAFFVFVVPVIHGAKPDVPHAGLALRLVDLDSGRVEAEFFELLAGADEPGPEHVSRGLRELGVQATR